MSINTDNVAATKSALEDMIIANLILVDKGVIDGFGHVSIRHPSKPDHYFMITDNSITAYDENKFMLLDAESNTMASDTRRPSIERFIHGEIYRARPDVKAIVHTHSPALIPFGVSQTPLRPLYHMCGFLAHGAPVFDIEHEHGKTNMLVTDTAKGKSLARSLNASAVVLMRGHGATIVGSSVQEATFRAIYTTVNAQLQPTAIQLGTPKYLSHEEAMTADELHSAVLYRPWTYWKSQLNAL